MSTTHRLHLADSSCAYGLPPPKPTAVGRYHFTTQVTSAAAAYRSIRSLIRPHWRPSSRVFRAYDESVQMGISSHVDRSCKTNEERRASEGECRCHGAWRVPLAIPLLNPPHGTAAKFNCQWIMPTTRRSLLSRPVDAAYAVFFVVHLAAALLVCAFRQTAVLCQNSFG
jgi:hypothetical protein